MERGGGVGVGERRGTGDDVLRRVADLYEEHAAELFALAAREAGKTLPDAVWRRCARPATSHASMPARPCACAARANARRAA